MVIVDSALKDRASRGQPVRAVVCGAGFMGRHITRQIGLMDGMEVVGVINRTEARAAANLADAGYGDLEHAGDSAAASKAIAAGRAVVTSDPSVLCGADGVDVLIETTGEVEFGAKAASEAIAHGIHVVLDNAELDATVGPLLKVKADQAGVVFTNIDGDEPGVALGLLRFVKAIGLRPVLVGNIKGFLDHHRNPDTQRAFAEKHKQDPLKASSFADGSKLASESTVLANATGFRVPRRGMNGYRLDTVHEILDRYRPDDLLAQPLVDFVLGAAPGSGVFVVGHEPDAERRSALAYLKMGEGPLHLFTRPFHLPHLEAALSAARAVLFGDPTVTPLGAPVCEMVAVAKKDLEVGETLDGIGGFACYALIENVDVARREQLVPMGLIEGAVMQTAVPQDTPLTLSDVALPEDRLIARLRAEQDAHFGV